jgi:hypothetical protein
MVDEDMSFEHGSESFAPLSSALSTSIAKVMPGEMNQEQKLQVFVVI